MRGCTEGQGGKRYGARRVLERLLRPRKRVSDGTRITRFAAEIMHVLINRISQKGFPSAEPVSGQIFDMAIVL